MVRLTLVCPTYNRPNFLERSVRYWSKENSVHVIYLDGSSHPLSMPWHLYDNITYIHDQRSYSDRVLAILDDLSSPYVCMICDDEFFIPSALDSCVTYLQNNEEFIACSGRAIGFSRSSRRVYFHEQYPLMFGRVLDSEEPFDRLSTHFNSYVPSHLYAVTRTNAFTKAMRCALTFDIDLFALFELVEEFLIVAQGKTCVIPELCWLRSFEAEPIRNTTDSFFTPSKSFREWWLTDNQLSNHSRKEFCHQLAKSCDYAVSSEQAFTVLDAYVHKGVYKKNPNGSLPRRSLRRFFSSFPPLLSTIKYCKRKLVILLGIKQLRSITAIRVLARQCVTIDNLGLQECVSAIELSRT